MKSITKKSYIVKKLSLFLCCSLGSLTMLATNHFVVFQQTKNYFPLINDGVPCSILVDSSEEKGVKIALNSFQNDVKNVCGIKPKISTTINSKKYIIVGTYNSPLIKNLVSSGKIEESRIKGKNEKFIIKVVKSPMNGVDEALVIAGSDKRGTIYGIYEVSQQIGVSPWYWWADVPILKHNNVYVKPGDYTDGEPAVKYRGIFLNDEAPCLTGWNSSTFGTKYGQHEMYSHVFELILRLRGNFMWPAMWNWAFYQDDTLNSQVANDMGVIIGTSHHEPMCRNHEEWVRNEKEYGAWNYVTNKKVLDQFFREGIERRKGTEDVVTIGMRGNGDEALSKDADVDLLKKIIKNQRKIITDVTKRPAEETPQVWALYKEVQDYYDKGLRVPDDVILLLSDDNWGDIRRLPNKEERRHPGGWGMYYHVDYVGSPRNSKWLNVTPIQNMWEQLQLTYSYGVDKMWILNVGDLKPMEYPISLFMSMAWNPTKYNPDNLLEHVYDFCVQQFGIDQAEQASKILNLYSKYNGRITPELLKADTYNIETGEWKQVSDEYMKLETEALRQYISIKKEYKDAYKQLILFPVQAMSNLYEMYYAQAMNHKLYAENNPEANKWADLVEKDFARDKALCYDYNHIMSNGKWNHMMDQKHISYVSWNDNYPKDVVPEVYRITNIQDAIGNYVYTGDNGYVAMEAEHYYQSHSTIETKWKVLPYMGRTKSAMILLPYTKSVEGAYLTYKMELPKDVDSVTVHVVVKSTLAFLNNGGHKYSISIDDGLEHIINFNNNLNEKPENINTIFYPTVVRRIVEKKIPIRLTETSDGVHILKFKPMDPGIVLEKILVDYGGYKKSYLFMNESKCKRIDSSKQATFDSFVYEVPANPNSLDLKDGENNISNPILPGCYPDPSICRVEKDYYLVNSSFSYFPGVPIWHSQDLKHWDKLGYVLNRKSQLLLKDTINIRSGIYAPDIEYNKDNKTYYMITTGVECGGTFYVTTDDPKKCNWSDPIFLPNVKGIDPSILFDDDGKAYITYNDAPDGEPKYSGHRVIKIIEFNWRDNLVVGKPKIIVNGGTDITKSPVWIEGPHLYHIEDTYYLMAAQGGTSINHSEVVFSSKNPYGPFIPCEINPILTQKNLDKDRINPVTCTGHADLVQTPNGKWYAVFLGVRPYKDNYDVMGRETFLLPVDWYKNQPVILYPEKAIKYNNYPSGIDSLWTKDGMSKDAFFIRTPQKQIYHIKNNGNLLLSLKDININEYKQPSAICRWINNWIFSATTSVNYTPKYESNLAGLVLFQNDECNICFGLSINKRSQRCLKLIINSKNVKKEEIEILLPNNNEKVYLKVSGDDKVNYTFSYKTDLKSDWNIVDKNVSADMLSTYVSGGFTGTAIGVYAVD